MNIRTLTLGAYQTNCYLVWQAGCADCIVIDPGYEPQTIGRILDSLGLRCSAILLTHGHFDHVGAVQALAADTEAPVYVHPEELRLPPMMTGGTLYATDHYAHGDTLQLAGLTLRIHHTPGHTPGGVCIQCEDALFTGDTLFAGSCGRTDFPGSKPSDMRRSLEYLSALPGDFRVFPGHGEASQLSRERRSNPFL